MSRGGRCVPSTPSGFAQVSRGFAQVSRVAFASDFAQVSRRYRGYRGYRRFRGGFVRFRRFRGVRTAGIARYRKVSHVILYGSHPAT
jgi:hypothetical protein